MDVVKQEYGCQNFPGAIAGNVTRGLAGKIARENLFSKIRLESSCIVFGIIFFHHFTFQKNIAT